MCLLTFPARNQWENRHIIEDNNETDCPKVELKLFDVFETYFIAFHFFYLKLVFCPTVANTQNNSHKQIITCHKGCEHECDAKTFVSAISLTRVQPIVQPKWLHYIEIDCRAGSGYTQLESEHHAQFFAFESLDSSHIGCNGEVLPTDSVDEPPQTHEPKLVGICAQP